MFIYKTKNTAIGWRVNPCFNITLHQRDLELLKDIQNYFGGIGNIKSNGNNTHYTVGSREELKIIINHFNKYPLKTSKFFMFNIFCILNNLLETKVHLTKDGFLKFVSIANKLNTPFTASELQEISSLGEIPYIEIDLPELKKDQLSPHWISGFTCGEGSFASLERAPKGLNVSYTPAMDISQKSSDTYILTEIKDYFGIGNVYHEKRGMSKYRLTRYADICNKMKIHFETYPICGHKQLQYNLWIQIVEILNSNKIRSAERDNKINLLLTKLAELKS